MIGAPKDSQDTPSGHTTNYANKDFLWFRERVRTERLGVGAAARVSMVSSRIPAGRCGARGAPRTRQTRALLTETYILVGDLYFVINAPCAYIRSYIRAVRLCPRRRSLLREPAEVVSMMEPSRESDRCESLIRRVAREIAAPLPRLLRHRGAHPYAWVSGDRVWRARERLVRSQARSALALIGEERGMARAASAHYGVGRDWQCGRRHA